MLPAHQRVTRSEDFARIIRRGSRAGRSTLVAHVLPPGAGSDPADGPQPARAGFVVSKAVGGSVQRNQVVRRLRHLVRAELTELPAGTLVVIRALPPSAGATSAELGADLGSALRAAARRGPRHRQT